MKKIFTQKLSLLIAFLIAFTVTGFTQTNYYVSPSGNNTNNGLSPATAKLTIQNAMTTAPDGSIINIANGTYTLPATLNFNRSFTVIGESEAGVIISATGVGAGWAFNINKSNSSVSNLTIIPNSVNGGYPVHVAANTNPVTVISNITLSHITIIGGYRTAFDFNAIDNLTVSYLTAKNFTNGNGIQFSGCNNVNASYLTTSGNAWGGVAIYVSKPSPSGVGRGSNNVNIDATTSSIAESRSIYNQNESGFVNTNISINGYGYALQNPVSSVGYTDYFVAKSAALTAAAAIPSPGSSIVTELATGRLVVGAGMRIQTAVNAAPANGAIIIEAGTYHEDVTINKKLALKGAGIDASIVSGVAGGGSSAFQITANGVSISGFTITRDGNSAATWNDPTLNTGAIGINAVGNAEISNCKFTGNRTAIDINNSNGNNIHNNIISDNRTGLLLRNKTDNTTVTENIITNNWTFGILFIDASAGSNSPVQSALNSNFSNNNISGNWYGQIADRQAGGSIPAPGTNPKNFTCNWYGSVSPTITTGNTVEPGYAAQIPVIYGGTATAPGVVPDISGPGSPNFIYKPYLTNGTDSDPVTTGFQPVSGTCASPISNVILTGTTNILCFGSSTGTAAISYENGIGSVTYSLDGAAAVAVSASPIQLNGLSGGAHTVVVTDAAGSVSVNFTITQPAAALTANYTFTTIACHGGLSTESITIFGGTAPYTVTNQGGGALVIGASEGVTYNGNTYAANYTYTVTDANGCQYVFTANITQPPVLTATSSATVIDNCHPSSLVTFNAVGGTAPYTLNNGTYQTVFMETVVVSIPMPGFYEYTISDANGCSVTMSVDVPYNAAPPVPVISVLPVVNAQCSVTVNAVPVPAPASTPPVNALVNAPTATDNCGNIITATTNDPLSYNSPGTYIIHWEYSDSHNNIIAIQEQTIVINDATAPVITTSGNISVNNDAGKCGATVAASATASDGCGVASTIGVRSDGLLLNEDYPVGVTTIVWTSTDIHSNVSTASQTITVTDVEVPVLITGSNLTVSNTTGICGANIVLAIPAATDNCGIASLTNSHPSGLFPIGTTTVTWTATDVNGNVSTATQNVTVNDTEAPVVHAQNITITLNASGTASITAAQINAGSTDNCTISSYSLSKTNFNCSNIGTNTITLTVTDAAGNSSSADAVVTVNNSVPVYTAVPDQAFCTNNSGVYSIPVFGASNSCGPLSITYSITGSTTRSGTGDNASGSFAQGVSTIQWMDGATVVGTTKVTINALPAVTITASNADAFCNKVTLTANSTVSGVTYKWMSGSSVFDTDSQASLGQTNGDGIYTVTVSTAGGCTSAAASYHYQKQNLLSSYAILATAKIDLGENNKVVSGSVGVTSYNGKVDFDKNSSVSSPGSFVKAKNIDRHGSNIVISNPIYSAATGIALPTMYNNTANTNGLPNKDVAQNSVSIVNGNYKNLTLKKGSRTTVTGNTFGTIRVEQGAQVTFTASTINIDKLDVVKGPRYGYSYIRFTNDTKILISGSVSIGSQVYINPDNKKVTFYMGDKKNDEERFSVKGGDTKVTANIFLPDGVLKVTGGYSYGDYGNGWGDCDRDDDEERYYGKGNSYVTMTGTFIAEQVMGNGKNVIWNSFDCGSAPVPVLNSTNTIITQMSSATKEGGITSEAEEILKVTVLPNPSTTYFTLKIASRDAAPVNLRVLDGSGRIVDTKSKLGANSTIQIGHDYSSGTYYVEMIQGANRKVVQLIKVRG
jgi:parallel beta-helix repeat protein